MKVLFVEPIVAHYRCDTFRIIMDDQHFTTYIIAGNEFENIKPAKINHAICLEYTRFCLFKHKFYYLKGFFKKVKALKPGIIVCSGVDFHHIHTILIFLWAKFTQRKFVWWSHGGLGHQGRVGKWVRSLIYRRADYILAYSQQGYDNLLELGVNNSKIAVIGNAINDEDYGFSKEFPGKSKNVFTLLYSGRLTPAKRVDVLLKAINVLKERGTRKYYCFIVGDGIIEELKKLSVELKIDDIVEFTGGLYGDDIVPFFQAADIFVYPGGIGLSIVHALSYGLPVITTDNYGLHFPEVELLVPGVNGDTFLDNNPTDLAGKIEEWGIKLAGERDDVPKECINTIFERGYLPAEQARKITGVLFQLMES